MAAPQTITRKDNDNMVDLNIYTPDHKPSWRTNGVGYAIFRVYGHRQATWLSVSLTESYKLAERWISKETMLTLDPESAIALRDTLNTMYPIDKP